MSFRLRTFLSYYRPYRWLLVADIICAVVVSAIALVLPLVAQRITQSAIDLPAAEALGRIGELAAVMGGLVVIQMVCNTIVDYWGHMMGTLMESDMRADLFDQYQTLSLGFHDEHRTGQLMSRVTNDLLAISELAHHGPEESIIALLKFGGAFISIRQVRNLRL